MDNGVRAGLIGVGKGEWARGAGGVVAGIGVVWGVEAGRCEGEGRAAAREGW